MLNCNRCHVQIRGYKHSCPLCGGPLTGEAEQPAFPTVPKKKFTRTTAVRIAAFLMIIILVALTVLRLSVDYMFSWIPLAVISTIIGFINVCIISYYRSNALKIMTWEVYIGMILSLIIDYYTGAHGWAVNWVLPAGFVGLMLAVMIIGACLRMRLQEFVLYLLTNTILSFTQLFFLVPGINTFRLPAMCSIAVTVIMFAGIVIFRWRDFKSASSRYFNI